MTPQVWKNLKSQFNKKSCEKSKEKAFNEEKSHSQWKLFWQTVSSNVRCSPKKIKCFELGFHAACDLLVTEALLAGTTTRDFGGLLSEF